MMRYKIEFLDYWHTSSGLSAGAKADSLALKDENGLPFISGKTIKGLLRANAHGGNLDKCFGTDKEASSCYFSNATLSQKTQKIIKDRHLQSELYTLLVSTKINKYGVSEDKSLREIEVVVPLTLYGYIDGEMSKVEKEAMIKALKSIKRLGLNRNRGLGRCLVEILGEEK